MRFLLEPSRGVWVVLLAALTPDGSILACLLVPSEVSETSNYRLKILFFLSYVEDILFLQLTITGLLFYTLIVHYTFPS